MKNMPNIKNSVIIFDDMGDKLKKAIAYYFRDGRRYNIQMIAMCHPQAQLVNTGRMSSTTIYITTYNTSKLFDISNKRCGCKHEFHGIIKELYSNYYDYTNRTAAEFQNGLIKYNSKEDTSVIIDNNRTMIYDSFAGFLDIKALSLKEIISITDITKAIAYMKPLMINPTDGYIINPDNYEFFFKKILAAKGIPKQNDVLTKETVNANF